MKFLDPLSVGTLQVGPVPSLAIKAVDKKVTQLELTIKVLSATLGKTSSSLNSIVRVSNCVLSYT